MKELNTRGMIHFIAPLVVILGFGLIGTLAIVISHAASGTTYYVSTSGNDSSNGTSPSTPWKTLSHVNTKTFKPGDSILLKAGDTFSGQLYFSTLDSGTTSNPIMVSSYGTGEATINGATGSAIYAYDTAGFKISNLILTGSGASTNTGAGINFYNDLVSGATLNYLYVTNVSATGFRNGMVVGGVHGTSGFSNVTVTNATFDNNQLAGLSVYGPSFDASNPSYANQNITVQYVTAYNNLGNSSLTGSNDSGNGIVLGSTSGGTIRNSSAYNNGASCIANACGVGIWSYDSKNVTIEHNVSYDNQTGSNTDGDGFDLDQNMSNSIMEYNYSYNNAGAGYLLFGASSDQSHTGNTVRFNVSQDDGLKNTEGGVVVYGNVNDDAVYNNTVYVSPSSNGGNPADIRVYAVGTSGGNTIRNNIFYAADSQWPAVVVPSESTSMLNFQDNDYYSSGKIYWGGTTYSSLTSWQSATGQEEYGSHLLGFTSNPDLVGAGNGTLLTNPANLTQLTQYKLASGSPLKNTGLNLMKLYSTNVGGSDFFGDAVPTTAGLSVGAAE